MRCLLSHHGHALRVRNVAVEEDVKASRHLTAGCWLLRLLLVQGARRRRQRGAEAGGAKKRTRCCVKQRHAQLQLAAAGLVSEQRGRQAAHARDAQAQRC